MGDGDELIALMRERAAAATGLSQRQLDLEPLRARLRSASARDGVTVGLVERRRGAMGSKPLVSGTRVPVATARRYLERGASTGEVLEAFPVLEADDVEAVRVDLTAAS